MKINKGDLLIVRNEQGNVHWTATVMHVGEIAVFIKYRWLLPEQSAYKDADLDIEEFECLVNDPAHELIQ